MAEMKILIIKLGALGDVVRTLSVLPAIKEKFPKSQIYWITKPNALQLFEGNPYVTKAFSLPYQFTGEEFDILYNFDIEMEATQLVEKISAKKKLGFYSQDEFPASFTLAGDYYLNTMFDDEIKKNNRRTYQDIMFETAELKWNKQLCPIFLNDRDKKYAEDFLKNNGIKSKNIIGLHTGASPRWPSKAWSSEKIKEFVKMTKKENYEILLFGGPEEQEKLKVLSQELSLDGIKIYTNSPKNTIKEFASLVNICKVMICCDSLALHVSLALKKPTIGLFFCTSPNEIEDYGMLRKIVSPMLYDFFPEKMDQYSEKLVNSISAKEVLKVVKSIA